MKLNNKLLISLLFTLISLNHFAQKSIVFPNNASTYAFVANNSSLNIDANQSFSITAWVKTTATANQLFIAKRLSAKGSGYELWQLNGYFAVNCTHTNGSSSGLPGGSKYKINDGKWHQIAFVVDVQKNLYFMYVDGKVDVSKALVSTTGCSNTDKLYIGLRGTLDMPMNGAMDEVRIYKRALSQAEIATDMSTQVTNDTPGLAAAWSFEEGAGTQAADIKGISPATLYGTPTWQTLSTKSTQLITMNGPVNVAFGNPDFSPATSTSPMPVEYSTSDASVASVVDGLIHIVAKGTCNITASQPENLFYTTANSVTQTLNVTSTLITFNLPFTNNAVIQRDKPVLVSGTADPNDLLTVTLDDESKTANVDVNGKWSCVFTAKAAKNTAFTLSAVGANSQSATLSNLLCGDVWLASGQSNMLMPVGPGYGLSGIVNYSTVVAAANYPQIRFIQPVDLWQQASSPQTNLLTSSDGWTVCSPSTAGGYSAVAYFFAKQIHVDQNVPIGIIQNAIGGTRIEAWTPLSALQSTTEYASWYTKATTTTLPANQVYDRKNFPTANFNGMLAPYTKNSVKGIIWYQGEENIGMDGSVAIPQYGNKFKATINAWRNVWGISDLPVLFVELANFQYSKNYSNLGGSREALPQFIAQQQKAAELPGVHGVTITDISNYTDIHPKEKATVGIRLGNAALGNVYGKNIVSQAATFKEMRSEGNALRVSFYNNSGFYIKSGTVLNEFKIAGYDKVYKTAQAVINGTDILVSESTIAEPLSVKFAWDENANPNLFNGSQSPTARFSESLKVNRINFKSLPEIIEVADIEVVLDANATSGLPVTFTSSDTTIAVVLNNVLKLKSEGTVVITAIDNGNTEYAAAPVVNQTVHVIGSTGTGHTYYNDLNIHIIDRYLWLDGLKESNRISVFNVGGQLVYSLNSKLSNLKLNLNGLNTGLYLIDVRNSASVRKHKLFLF
ncbi:MAG: T9SS type A sorting domain-containing protein [Paludibacteraceae bacterium]|nr:T9SS type A sorting domain-containing protein [Paludibacteraceae bacterium]